MVIPVPPTELRFMDASEDEFLQSGWQMVGELRSLADLDGRRFLVDLGSGYGRLAHALRRAAWPGRYVGLDILPRHIDWCRANLADDRFSFLHLDLRNDRYRPEGGETVAITLPVLAHTADLIVVNSVFTHLWPEEVTHYLGELRRLLVPDGLSYTTWFLVDEDQRMAESQGKTTYQLLHKKTDFCWYADPDSPLHVVGYDAEWVALTAREQGLEVVQRLHGEWLGRREDRFQDVLLVRPIADW